MPGPADALYPSGPSNKLGNEQTTGMEESNIIRAMKEMKLNTQEMHLYRMHLDNLNGPGGVDNEDGSRSSLRQMTVGIGDKVYNLPTVWDGKILGTDESIERAKKIGLDNFPSYKSQKEAEDRYQKMHDYMEKDTAKYLSDRAVKQADDESTLKGVVDYRVNNDPEADVGISFMKAGNVPKVGELSSEPSKNIEKRGWSNVFMGAKPSLPDTSAFGTKLSKDLGFEDIRTKRTAAQFPLLLERTPQEMKSKKRRK